MTMNTASLTLNQSGLRGPIELQVGEATDKKSPATLILTPLVVAFSTLIDEHEPLDLGENEEPKDYSTTLKFTHDTEVDTCLIDAQFDPDISQYNELAEMPDSYQMMQLIVMQFLENVGAIDEDGVLDESRVVETTAPATKH